MKSEENVLTHNRTDAFTQTSEDRLDQPCGQLRADEPSHACAHTIPIRCVDTERPDRDRQRQKTIRQTMCSHNPTAWRGARAASY